MLAKIRSESVGFSATLDLADGRLIMVCAPKDKRRRNLHLPWVQAYSTDYLIQYCTIME